MTNGACEAKWWTASPTSPLVQRQVEKLRALEDVRRVAVMPDVQAGTNSVNGCAIATRSLIYPYAVGQDIGCGLSTVALDGDGSAIADRGGEILEALVRAVPVLKHWAREQPSPANEPDGEELSCSSLRKAAAREGALQIGTLGRGNHFVEVQLDEAGRAWLLVHSGSRGMGPVILGYHLRGVDERGSSPALDAGGDAGRGYLADAAWAVRYATSGRRRMLAAGAEVLRRLLGLSADWSAYMDSPHNFIRREVHGGEELLVHRKSVASARADEPGIIAGSSGTFSVHVEGRGCAEAMASSSHGAGRVMSRSEARARVSPRDLRRQMRGVCFDERRVAALIDEAPGVYRDLRVVLESQRELVRVTRRLRPVISMKGV